MPGFLAEIRKNVRRNFSVEKRKDLLIESFASKDYYVERRTINKFLDDKVFHEDSEIIILTEGIILNRKELINKYKQISFIATIKLLYAELGEKLFNEFNGSFSGLIYDKIKNHWLIFTNHIGDKQVYYSIIDDTIILGSSLNYLINYFQSNSISYSLDLISAYCILEYGYNLGDLTLIKEIKRLKPGSYIKIKNQNVLINEYFRLDNTPDDSYKENELVEEVDRLFRHAIKLAFEKDREYGYKHIVSLSGGLDSRMVSWVANRMGYKDILNFTFSQTDCLEESIAQKIASYLEHEYVFKSLDNGKFLFDIENTIKLNGGNSIYYALGHSKSCLDLLNLENFGIIHTGQVGSILKGGFLTGKNHTPPKSTDLISKLLPAKSTMEMLNSCENVEIFKLYSSSFLGILQGNLSAQEKSEVISPFLENEFMKFTAKIHPRYRYNSNLYIKWINTKYPEAAKFKWERVNSKINSPRISIGGKSYFLNNLPSLLVRKMVLILGLSIGGMNSKHHMNPLDYWYRTNLALRNFMDKYIEENINILKGFPKLMQECSSRYNQGDGLVKNKVLTLISAIKIYFKR